MPAEITLDGCSLTPAGVERVSLGAEVALAPGARAAMASSAAWYATHHPNDIVRSKWEWLIGGDPPSDSAEAARLFVIGHCAGVGDPLPEAEVRAMIVARAGALAGARSGVRPEVVDRLLALLSRGWIPVVPSIGAVGVAGAIQLAHVARVALGYGGDVLVGGRVVPSASLVAGLPPLVPTEKEALALINGASWTVALAALAVARAERVYRAAVAATALSFEVVRADLRCLSAAAAAARGHRGATAATTRLRALLDGSELVTAQRSPDSFSVRCAPAVLGSCHDALAYVREIVVGELNAPNDNPLVLPDAGGVIEAGVFHAAPVALAMDHLKAALVQVASIGERRIFRLTYGRLSGLPSFLVPDSGVNSGLMLAQYTAASVLSEAKGLCMPASIDTIPTVQHQEDHVSMGPVAARGALEVVDRVADVVAIELMCAAQGLDFRVDGRAVGPDGVLVDVPRQAPAPATRAVWELVRARVARWDEDRVLHTDLATLGAAVRAGVFSAE